MSVEQAEYFTKLQEQVDLAYSVASACREKSLDATNVVEIPQAADMASRVHQLLEFLHERLRQKIIKSEKYKSYQ